jgi:hypothetical protein
LDTDQTRSGIPDLRGISYRLSYQLFWLIQDPTAFLEGKTDLPKSTQLFALFVSQAASMADESFRMRTASQDSDTITCLPAERVRTQLEQADGSPTPSASCGQLQANKLSSLTSEKALRRL